MQTFHGSILGLALLFAFPGQAAPGQSTLSENGRFSVETTATSEFGTMLVAVFKHEGDAKPLAWTRKVHWASANPRAFPNGNYRRVSDDGRWVVLREQGLRPDDIAWFFLNRDDDAKHLTIFDMEHWIGAPIDPSETNPYMGFARTLNFIWNEKALYCVWFPEPQKWALVDLKTSNFVVPDEITAKELDEMAKSRALSRLNVHQPGAVRALLKPIQEKAAEFLPGFQGPAAQHILADEELYASYVFLAARREPKAQRYIEGLLAYPISARFSGLSWIAPPVFSLTSHERVLGDALWSQWNNLEALFEDTGAGFPRQNRKLNYLGLVKGLVKLPIVVSQAKAGPLWLYLIPANLKQGAWETDESVTTLLCEFGLKRPGPMGGMAMGGMGQPADFDEVHYLFSTITPGEYRVKAVWDRRPPYASGEARAFPSPGDYESAESTNFVVTAGARLSVNLQCTNRVGDAEEYFTADDVWRRLRPEPAGATETPLNWGHVVPGTYRGPEIPPAPSRNSAPKYTPAATTLLPLEKFVLATNKTGREVVLKQIRLLSTRLAHTPSLASEEQLEFLFELNFASGNSPSDHLEVLVIDEHGCRFHTMLNRAPPSDHQGQTVELAARAPVYPRTGRFYLDVRGGADDRTLASYTLANAIPVGPQTWDFSSYSESLDFPLRRDLGDVVVRLLRKPRRLTAPLFKFFTPAGEEIEWVATGIHYEDWMGNHASKLGQLCAKLPSAKLYAAFLPDFTFPFPEDRIWKTPLAETPEPGEFRHLNLRTNISGVEFEILAVTGKGEFDYVDGQIHAATARFDPEARPDYFARPPLKWGDPELVFVRQESHPHGVRAKHRDVVISRVPHLSLRVRGLKPEQYWTVLEERKSVWRSLYDASDGFDETEPWYLAVNRTKISDIGQITIVVQNAKTEEFVVPVAQ